MRDLLRLLRESVSSRPGIQFCDPSSTEDNGELGSTTDVAKEQMPLRSHEYQVDIAKYTSILKEKGDKAGFVPSYNFKQTQLMPPLFKAVVSFQDYVFDGSGRTKQQAKHVASREACNALGLML